jgi:hypothetical protein
MNLSLIERRIFQEAHIPEDKAYSKVDKSKKNSGEEYKPSLFTFRDDLFP